MSEFNLEAKIAEQENNSGKVQNAAVNAAKESIAKKKLDEETRQVERRLSQAETTEEEALKRLRMARKREAALKTYLTAVSTAKAIFEQTGNYAEYDKAVEKAETERDEAVSKAKHDIYGDEAWRY